MKTLYALVLILMSAPTLAFGCESDHAVRDGIYAGSSPAPVTEVEDYSFIRELKPDNDTVLALGTPQLDYSIEVGADFFVNEIAAQLTQKIEQDDADGRAIKVDDDYTASISEPWMQHIDYELGDNDPDF